MEKLRAALKKLFCLPPLPTVLFAVFGYGAVLAVAVFRVQDPVLQYISYIASAYALIITITGFPRFLAFARAVRRRAREHPLAQRLRGTPFGERFSSDARFRMGLSLYRGFFVNLAYIVIKLASGIYYRSAWFVSLAVYYALLAVMRFLLIRRLNAPDTAAELRRYRLCGFMLLFMNQALAGIVIFMVHENRGFDYPGVLIYAMAAYAFYAVTVAIVNLVKTRRSKSPLIAAAKAVNLVAAMVSILSLETAMLARFGGDDDPLFRKTMTAATGGGVCTAVIAMAVYMIWRAGRELKKPAAKT